MPKAMVAERYGPPHEVLRLSEVEAPTAGEGEVLLRVRAASANPVEWHLVRGEPFLVRLIAGLRRPRDPLVGGDAAGVVEAVGPGVSGLAPGDEVFGTALGSFAELARAKAERLARKPERLTFEQAAAIPVAGCTALQALRDHGRLQAGGRVLVIGAAGGVGSFAVQLAKAMGAEVTGVCSTANVGFVTALGADAVIDYTQEPLAGLYDLVVQLAGDWSIAELRGLLAHGGTVVLAGSGTGRDGGSGALGPLTRMAIARLVPRFTAKRVTTFVAKVRQDDLETLGRYADSGSMTPAVERTYPLEEAAVALAAIESGHTRGKIVLTI